MLRTQAEHRLPPFTAILAAIAIVSGLAACGGGGGGPVTGSPEQPDINPPVVDPADPTPPTTSQSLRFTTAGEDISFGVNWIQGSGDPWTSGPAPIVNLADNPDLLGTVSWWGWLRGYTPDAQTLHGDAGLTIDLATLDGELEFTNLETWTASPSMNDPGDGTPWHDGELSFDVDVRDNTFARTGGDAGTVSGRFLGSSHHAMAGTLHRDDLNAAFGGGNRSVTPPPLPDAGLAAQSPIIYVGPNFHIGADVAPAAGDLQTAALHGDTAISHGTVADGIGAAALIAYLRHASERNNTPTHIRRFGASPPTLRIAEGTSAEHHNQAVRTVQMINAALPHDWQLRIAPAPGPTLADQPTAGEIHLHFRPYDQWPSRYQDTDRERPPAGIALHWARNDGQITRALVFVDHIRVTGRDRLDTLVHEIIHSLGRGHPDPDLFPHTIMLPNAQSRDNHILYPLDREALLAVYSRLQPGATAASLAEDLGPWSDTSTHLLGELTPAGQNISFGVALRNGLAQPWATGPAPRTDLTDNTALSGTASWSGRLLGFTPDAEPVAGAADLAIALDTLNGDLEFSELEYWSAGQAPGAAGSGATWNDGDLSYDVDVRGNTFVRNRGDEGIVTGAFLGRQHQAMGGTLQRDDLSAAFGGSR